MNTITVITELCQEDRNRLDVISDTLELIRQALVNGAPVAPVMAQDAPQSEPKAEPTPEAEAPVEAQNEQQAAPQTDLYDEDGGELTPEPEAPIEEAPAEEAPTVEPVALSDIQKKVVALSAAGKKAEVREIVTKYASRVSAIPVEHTAEVWQLLCALEA